MNYDPPTAETVPVPLHQCLLQRFSVLASIIWNLNVIISGFSPSRQHAKLVINKMRDLFM